MLSVNSIMNFLAQGTTEPLNTHSGTFRRKWRLCTLYGLIRKVHSCFEEATEVSEVALCVFVMNRQWAVISFFLPILTSLLSPKTTLIDAAVYTIFFLAFLRGINSFFCSVRLEKKNVVSGKIGWGPDKTNSLLKFINLGEFRYPTAKAGGWFLCAGTGLELWAENLSQDTWNLISSALYAFFPRLAVKGEGP